MKLNSFFKAQDVPEAVSVYSLMKNRRSRTSIDPFIHLDNIRERMNKEFLLKERQESDKHFLAHTLAAKELESDPRFSENFN